MAERIVTAMAICLSVLCEVLDVALKTIADKIRPRR